MCSTFVVGAFPGNDAATVGVCVESPTRPSTLASLQMAEQLGKRTGLVNNLWLRFAGGVKGGDSIVAVANSQTTAREKMITVHPIHLIGSVREIRGMQRIIILAINNLF